MRISDFAGWSLALLLSGCAATGTSSPAAPASPAPADADCGTFDLGQGETVPESASRCLVDAVRTKRAARLAVSEPTVEGDPIRYTYTAYAGGGLEVVLDSRHDGFGPKAVTTQTCSGVDLREGRLTTSGCSEPKPVPG